MTDAHRTAEAQQAAVGDALTAGRHRAGGATARPVVGPRAVLALQRQAGTTAVGALMAARALFPGEQGVANIDAALREVRRDEPAVDTVEKSLKAAQTAGVPVASSKVPGPRGPLSP